MSPDIPNRLSADVDLNDNIDDGSFQSFPDLDISQSPGFPNQGYMGTPAHLTKGFVDSAYGDLNEKNYNQAYGNLDLEPITAVSTTGLSPRQSTSIILSTTSDGTLNPEVLCLRGFLSSEQAPTLSGPLGFGGALTSEEPPSLQNIPAAAEVRGGGSSYKTPGNWPGYPNNPPHSKKQSQDNERPRIATTRASGLTLRGQRMRNFKAEEYYQDLPETPPSWSSPGNNFVFEYNRYGELANGIRLSKEQMEDFLFNHPLRNFDLGKGSLILWVQSAPVDSCNRYPTQNSDKCRFADCPVKNNTIHRGFFRVAIDQNPSGLKINPYHCAGFVHLYCLEKFLDFPKLCREINIQPDNRSLPEPRNKMAITRDYSQLFGLVDDFIKQSRSQPTWDYQGQPWDYTKTLSHQLTEKCLELEPKARQRVRGDGNHRSRHRGDLVKFVEGERGKVVNRRQGGKWQDESDSEESPRPHKRRPMVE